MPIDNASNLFPKLNIDALKGHALKLAQYYNSDKVKDDSGNVVDEIVRIQRIVLYKPSFNVDSRIKYLVVFELPAIKDEYKSLITYDDILPEWIEFFNKEFPFFDNKFFDEIYITPPKGNPEEEWKFKSITSGDRSFLSMVVRGIKIALYENETGYETKKEPLQEKHPTGINWPPAEDFSHNPTDSQIGLESILPEPGRTTEYYIDGWGWNDNYYSKDYQKKKSKEAQKIGGIQLYDLVFIFANEMSHNEFLPGLWSYTGFNDDHNDSFPNWKPSMIKNKYIRAHVWYWLLCGWTIYDEYKGDYPAKSCYFGKIEEDGHIRWERKIKLLNLYRFANGQFERVEDSEIQTPEQYVNLDEFETYIKKIDPTIPLPEILYPEGDEVNKPELESFTEGIDEPCDRYPVERVDSEQFKNNSFILNNDFWEVRFRGENSFIRDLERTRYVVLLLENQDKEFPSYHLV